MYVNSCQEHSQGKSEIAYHVNQYASIVAS